jgi:hypothetical protein
VKLRFGWLAKPVQAWLLSPFTSQKFGMIFAERTGWRSA